MEAQKVVLEKTREIAIYKREVNLFSAGFRHFETLSGLVALRIL